MAESGGAEPVIESQEKEGSLAHVVSCLKVTGKQARQLKNEGRCEWVDQAGRKIAMAVSRADGFSGFQD